MLEILICLTISFLIGLLIGVEREHSHAEGKQPIGIRTFILLTLLGTLTSIINQPFLSFMISFFVTGMILLGYFRATASKNKDLNLGMTTEIAAAMIFCLGYMIPTAKIIAITVSALVLLVLIERQRLHILARKKFNPHEIEAVIILIIFSLGILPILPDYAIDPWGLFNPHNFGLLIMAIAVLQFGGYIAIRLFGEFIGIALTGFLGGFVSSTAVYATLPHTIQSHPQSYPTIMASCLLAILAMLIEVIIIIFIASPTLLIYIMKPLIVMSLTCIVISAILLHYQKPSPHPAGVLIKPLNLLSLLRTSVIIAGTLVTIAAAKHYIGTDGILIISFLGGLFEIHGISLATALLFLDHHLTLQTATLILYVAISATFVSKIFLLCSLTTKQFAFITSLCLLAILASGVIAYWLYY